ncbi:Stc1 domain-containing protein [Trichophaea hybrida]|nr:Stc1 domain-containing protein [Trichophaea hybrida]
MPPPHLPPVGRNLVNQRNKKDANVSNGYASFYYSYYLLSFYCSELDFIHSGGIPNEITCYVCKKSKPRSQYANRQLQKFADTIHNPYAPAGRCLTNPKTTCRTCTPQQTTELTCCICHKTKGLGQFAKNQRKTPTKARCQKCVQMHLDTEPDYEPPDSDEYESYSEEEDDSDDFDGNEARGGQKPQVRRSVAAAVAAAADENARPRYADSAASVAYGDFDGPSRPAAMAPDDDEDEDFNNGEWEEVKVAGAQKTRTFAAIRTQHLPELSAPTSTVSSTYNRSSTTSTTKKNGWAKPEKIPKGQEVKWGQTVAQESDQWDRYGRELANRRDGTKKNVKPKKKNNVDVDIEDEHW